MRLKAGKMDVERGVGNLDFVRKQQHGAYQQKDRPEE